MLEAKSLRKAQIPSSLIPNPSPGHLQSTRLALHVDDRQSLCSIYVASGCHVYNIEISTEESIVTKGKESLLIPVQAQVVKSSLVDRCPHRSEIQSVVLGEEDGDSSLIMGTVDSYGHLIVSRVDVSGAATYNLLQILKGSHIRCHLGIVVQGKAVGLGYASAQHIGLR